MPRRQRNSPVTRRDGVPARHGTAALSNARYALFGRISKSHGIAPTTSYIGTLKVLQPPFMSALTPNRLLSTFRTFLQIFKKSSFDRGEAGSLRSYHHHTPSHHITSRHNTPPHTTSDRRIRYVIYKLLLITHLFSPGGWRDLACPWSGNAHILG